MAVTICMRVSDHYLHGAAVPDPGVQRSDWWSRHPPAVPAPVQARAVLLRHTEEDSGECWVFSSVEKNNVASGTRNGTGAVLFRNKKEKKK